MHNDKHAMDRVLKARSALILARRFYGVLVSNVEPVLSHDVPTAATNGKKHFWNPDFIAELTQARLEFVQAHESEHDARHHGTRRGDRDPKKWNEATDFGINIDLKDEGFDVPPWALLDERFRGMSAEDIYRMRELDEQNNKPQPQPEPEPEQGEDEGDDADTDEDKGDEPEASDEEGDEEGDEGQGDDGEDGDEEGKGEGPADDGDEETDGGQGAGDSEAEGDGTGEGTGSADGDADGEPGEGQPQSSGDPGRCGEVLDAAEDAGDLAEIDQKWERTVRQAASMAKAIGQLPGHVSRDIERANNPGQDWREVLRAWFDQGSLQVETWNRPNRRFVGAGLFLPGKRRDGINRVAFLIDTSGSMDTIALACIRNEAQAALDDGAIDEVIAVYGDTQVTRVDTWRTGDEIEFDPRGGGGTRLRPLFDYVAEQADDCSLIVCFTDMEFEDLNSTEPPACPVLFAATGYPDKVRRYLADAPWGAAGIDVGAH